MAWIDTHCHLAEAEFDHDRDEVIQRALKANVKTIVLIGVGIQGAKRALALAETNTMFYVALGFHPEEVHSITEQDWMEMEGYLTHPKVIAVGEIGLDYYWDKDSETHIKQEALFIRQIELANALNKPIIIHSRDALQKTYDLLKSHPVKRCGIMHCYSGSQEMAHEFTKLGYFISLAGPVTFKNAHTPKEVAQAVDLNHLLIETDAPYLSPVPHRGERNESAYVVETAAVIAHLRGISMDDLMKALSQNFSRLFPETLDK